MSSKIFKLLRDLSPFEHLVCGHLCDGKSNSAIAKTTYHTEKAVENTVSRSAHAFSIKSNSDINVRVLLALAYRSYFGDSAIRKLESTSLHRTNKANMMHTSENSND